jgi:flavodoxin
MNSTVIYASRSGNTQHVAERVADALRERGDVEIFEVEKAPTDLSHADLVVIGGPTEAHGMTAPMSEYLDRLDSASLQHRPVAVFDTRLAWPRFLSGSAAEGISRKLRADGALVVLTPESFIVSSKPELQPGELDRATRWANEVAQAVHPRTSAHAAS